MLLSTSMMLRAVSSCSAKPARSAPVALVQRASSHASVDITAPKMTCMGHGRMSTSVRGSCRKPLQLVPLSQGNASMRHPTPEKLKHFTPARL
eukprot:355664-Chlamydomonas_euryale.AAC.4